MRMPPGEYVCVIRGGTDKHTVHINGVSALRRGFCFIHSFCAFEKFRAALFFFLGVTKADASPSSWTAVALLVSGVNSFELRLLLEYCFSL